MKRPPQDAVDADAEQEGRQLMHAVVLPNDGPLTEEKRLEVARTLREHMTEHGITEAQIARQVGLGATTVYAAVKGTWSMTPKKMGRVDDHLRQLNMWMEADARRRATRPEERFVRTRVAAQIIQAAKVAIQETSIVLVVGPSGIGKTMVAHYVYEENPGAVYLRLGRRLRTHTRLCNRLADVLRVTGGRMQASLRRLPIEERVFETLRDSNRLLIIDEGHKLSDDGLDFLRDIYDETNVPILLLCTIDLWERIQAEADADHGQLFSRCECFTIAGSDLEPGRGNDKIFSLTEIRQVFEQPKVKLHPTAVEFLHCVANDLGHGCLRKCRMLVNRAVRIARQAAGDPAAAVTLTAEMLEHAELKWMRSQRGRQLMQQRRKGVV